MYLGHGIITELVFETKSKQYIMEGENRWARSTQQQYLSSMSNLFSM